jgi:deoxyguanosine kinase
MLHKKHRYIVIEGNIGAGKTSLAKKLSSDVDGHLLLEEFAENSFLPKFYENPTKYAFPLEMSFLAARFQQLSQTFEKQIDRPIISDYHIRKSLLFAQVTLDPAEKELYKSFYEIVTSKIPEPELVIILKKSVKQLQSNISKRGRTFESSISEEYLNSINHGYQQLARDFTDSRVLEIETGHLDFVNNFNDYQTIIDLINNQ